MLKEDVGECPGTVFAALLQHVYRLAGGLTQNLEHWRFPNWAVSNYAPDDTSSPSNSRFSPTSETIGKPWSIPDFQHPQAVRSPMPGWKSSVALDLVLTGHRMRGSRRSLGSGSGWLREFAKFTIAGFHPRSEISMKAECFYYTNMDRLDLEVVAPFGRFVAYFLIQMHRGGSKLSQKFNLHWIYEALQTEYSCMYSGILFLWILHSHITLFQLSLDAARDLDCSEATPQTPQAVTVTSQAHCTGCPVLSQFFVRSECTCSIKLVRCFNHWGCEKSSTTTKSGVGFWLDTWSQQCHAEAPGSSHFGQQVVLVGYQLDHQWRWASTSQKHSTTFHNHNFHLFGAFLKIPRKWMILGYP